MSAQHLDQQFGLGEALTFHEDPSGLVLAQVNNDQSQATLCLQGAHLMSWHPKSQAQPVVWLSRAAKLAVGKSIRGGVPVCWPWFGPHASNAALPAHGFARTVPWKVMESGNEAGGATRLCLRLMSSDATRAQWPQDFQLDLTVIIGETLRLELRTENSGTTSFVIGEALHTYFQIGDIGAVHIAGLDGSAYWDKVGGSTLRQQSGVIRFQSETDRVYVNSTAECRIEDAQLRRSILIQKSGSRSTVVWNPWTDKAEKMGDLGQPAGWRQMLCVESGNAFDNVVSVAPGSAHTLIAAYSVAPI